MTRRLLGWFILLTTRGYLGAADAQMEQWCWSNRVASSATPFADRVWGTKLPRSLATWANASRRLTESDWQDLFAFFYSLQFAEPPAEAGRGKRVLESKRCTECHSLTKAPATRGPSVPDWAPMDDPVVLVYQMWNHARVPEFTQSAAVTKPTAHSTGRIG